jgi:predicted N-acyltransferase
LPSIHILSSYQEIDADEWDQLVGEKSPFLEHVFLMGLEACGCAIPRTGWSPRPITIRDDANTLIAAAPGWVKTHSMGEFVYDHSWADASIRAGIPYYPKLIVGVPFTPVTGSRLLFHRDHDPAFLLPILMRAVAAASEDTHGVHILFNSKEEAAAVEKLGGFRRTQFQFQWTNQDYTSFGDFLARLQSKYRKAIRRERRCSESLRIDITTRPDQQRIDAVHQFYSSTCRNFGPWGRVYMNQKFFRHLAENWGHRLLLITAWRGGEPIAGTFNVIKGETIYGRHWGCIEQVKFLHFELCYYQTIEYAIANNYRVFEPGQGGHHKLKRGFNPNITYSNHWLANSQLHDALERHTAMERRAVQQHVRAIEKHSPYKSSD